MAVTVENILELLERIAPAHLQESYDNVGLLAGHPQNTVSCILVALDLTLDVVKEAQKIGAELIVTHHPIFFRGRKNLREDDPEGAAVCEMIRRSISMIAVHTNFDNAPCGVNDALAQHLEMIDIEAIGSGIRIGMLPIQHTPVSLGSMIERKLGGKARVYASDAKQKIERIAVCGGSGGDFFREVLSAGAQAYVTGEIRYHDAIDAVSRGLCVVEAGHYETEHIALKLLADSLQALINEIQYKVTVRVSAHRPFEQIIG